MKTPAFRHMGGKARLRKWLVKLEALAAGFEDTIPASPVQPSLPAEKE